MSDENTGGNIGELRDGPRGGKLKRGNPKNRGGTGRPPNEFKQRMQALASQKNVEDYLRKCIRGDFGPKFFLQALQFTADRGYGKPTQPLEHSGPEGGPIEVRELTDAELVERARQQAQQVADAVSDGDGGT